MAAATAPSPAQEDEFYAKILALRDAAIAGTHPTFKLPAAAIEQLKASLLVPESQSNAASQHPVPNGADGAAANGSHLGTNVASHQTPPYPGFPGLSYGGVPSANEQAKASTSAGLDPIFLEKSDSLVRAEGQLKRQRIERDLQDQAEKHHKHTTGREKEQLSESPSAINIDAALGAARKRVGHVSGLKTSQPQAAVAKSVASSFDENDYYSSKAGSDWSGADSPDRRSDDRVNAFTADYETLDAPRGAAQSGVKALGKRPAFENDQVAATISAPQDHSEIYDAEPDGVDEADDEDEEYSPPDPTAFDSFCEDHTAMDIGDSGADDDSEYEPGELTHEDFEPTPREQQPATYPAPPGPIIRNNHLTHIAAPQPNRVSPLAVQKRPSLELELVNGCPVVKRPDQSNQQNQPRQFKQAKQKGIKRKGKARSRASSGSPTGTRTSKKQKALPPQPSQNTKKKDKKEKRKSREERQAAQSPPSPMHREPYIKPEPVSPPPSCNVPEAQTYGYGYPPQSGPIEIYDSPQEAPQQRYMYPPVPHQEYVPQAPSPTVVRVGSPSAYRPVQRDTQDLRRVASLQFAHRPASPLQPAYSPVAQKPRHASVAPATRDYTYREEAPVARYQPVEAQQEPLRFKEYRESSPAMMPPPPVAPRRIVVDQYGNRYYAAEPAPDPRASVAPVARAPEPDTPCDRAPSRMSVAYAPPQQPARYEPADSRMPPPPPPVRRHAPQDPLPVEYIDSNGYRVREYSTRPAEPQRYSVAPTSPVYQQSSQYESMPPPPLRRMPQYEQVAPPAAPQEPTSPIYAQPPRAYSVRPDGYQATYAPRQASVAPVQYAPPTATPSARAASVAPRAEYGALAPQGYHDRAPSYAPQPAVRYVDEYGREVVPREVRQVGEYGY